MILLFYILGGVYPGPWIYLFLYFILNAAWARRLVLRPQAASGLRPYVKDS